jgi:predicted nuclease of predicted toxin-antitoxin system
MTIWIDAQISPFLADWLKSEFKIDAIAVRDLDLHQAKDKEIFEAARKQDVIVITKDIDFKILQDKWGSPPKII